MVLISTNLCGLYSWGLLPRQLELRVQLILLSDSVKCVMDQKYEQYTMYMPVGDFRLPAVNGVASLYRYAVWLAAVWLDEAKVLLSLSKYGMADKVLLVTG